VRLTVTACVLAAGTQIVLAELALFARVAPGDSTWTVDGAELQITLEKAGEGTWGRLEAAS
jgi:hypothetical protein